MALGHPIVPENKEVFKRHTDTYMKEECQRDIGAK